MDVTGSIALVTGANRGIGRRFVDELLTRGAAKVYATARRPELIEASDPRVVPLHLDLLDAQSVANAAAAASDVTLLVNNAGVATHANLLTGDLEQIRLEHDTHFFGTLAVTRAFAPVLAANGGGAVVNILSVLSWMANNAAGAYCTAKAAEWSLTNVLRLDLAGQKTLVQAVHLGAADTDIMAGYDVPKIDPIEVARASLDGVQSGAVEVLIDDASRFVKSSLATDPAEFYAQSLTN
ncbi:SDR family oxidoreductase [Amycolatopsis sp. GM8]|uniref:SDR family oxidoreductase n=1 Tax=Amycolatopsis sp. GM8 TaxID=2896530 RepID=UPI001F42A08D|nr:SDR family oxidoreductase [Amycolatopsis sp. GM8]